MHNAAFRRAQIDAVYLPLRATTADDFLAFAQGIGLHGASVTIPFKVALFERMDEVTDAGRRAGAINTVRVDDRGRRLGDNTDAAGFLRPLQDRQVSLRSARVSVLGAGGSARAVAVSSAALGAQVTVHARRREQAESVAQQAGAQVGPWPPEAGSWDLLVNCTPIGMHPAVDDTPVPARLLSGRLVYDLVYNPPVTRLLREAASAGCGTLNGLEMLVAQAQAQFEWWTGMRPDGAIMRAAAERRLSELIADEHHHV
jgi:shikimate dehydrogenase